MFAALFFQCLVTRCSDGLVRMIGYTMNSVYFPTSAVEAGMHREFLKIKTTRNYSMCMIDMWPYLAFVLSMLDF